MTNVIVMVYVIWSSVSTDGDLYRQAVPMPDATLEDCQQSPAPMPAFPDGVVPAYIGHACVEVSMSQSDPA